MQPRSPCETPILYYVPILHTNADMGDLGKSLAAAKVAKLGRQGLKRGVQSVDRAWDEIERAVRGLSLPPHPRIYQDGLPVCGHESAIVADLAHSGSRNHRLLLWLQERGGELMGTESGELLIEEYELARTALANGASRKAQHPNIAAELLERRDRFIAARVNETLHCGETGILFLGALHSPHAYFKKELRILYPVRNY